jgi:hypothetical protein
MASRMILVACASGPDPWGHACENGQAQSGIKNLQLDYRYELTERGGGESVSVDY